MGRFLNFNLPPATIKTPVVKRPVLPPNPAARIQPARPVPAAPVQEQDNSLRKIAFYFGLALLATTLGVFSDLLYYVLHTHTYLLYLFGPPAVLGAFITGAIPRMWRHRAAKYWVAFFVWMVISIPFSTWHGASFGRVLDYFRFIMPLLMITAGMPITWREVQSLFNAICFTAVVGVGSARFFAAEINGRLTLESSSTIGNSNDLSQHLVMLLPFILYLLMNKKHNIVIRYALYAPLLFYGIWVILGTGSRGGLLALVGMFLFMIWRARPMQRVAILAIGFVAGATFPVLVPGNAQARLKSLVGEAHHEEAEESGEAHAYLFRKSVLYTVQHPIFGVGPDQFSNYEGLESTAQGRHGNWHATHCSWTQISSECGIPALLFCVLGIGSALASVNRVFRRARKEGYTDIENACFCYLISMVGLIIALTFLANAYRVYLTVMVGLAVAIGRYAIQYMDSNPPNKPAPLVVPPVFAVR
jgi:O-antigen ligase